MDIVSIRRNKLRLWFSGKPIPEPEKSYISQLINGKASFGEKAARRLEKTYKMPNKYLDEDEQSPAIDLSNVSIEKLEFIKRVADMNNDEFRATAELFNAADKLVKSGKKQGNGE